MPKYLIYFLIILCHCASLPKQALAITNPTISTSSATATVPSTTPTTGDTTAPSAPIIVRPVDGANTGDNKTEFAWRQSLDSNSNVVTYTLYFNGVATYLGISNVGNSAAHGYTARLDGQEIKLVPTTAILDGIYNWYVVASDGSGNTSHSATWNLTIDTVAPHILVNEIDTHHNLLLDSDSPENFVDQNYVIAGPKDVYFTIHSEPWSTITLQFYGTDNQLITQSSWPVDGSGRIYPHTYLNLGDYRLVVSSFDRGGNTMALPDIKLTIKQTQISITLPTTPGQSPIPIITIPYSPLNLTFFPATIANVGTRVSLPYLIYLLLAVSILILLNILWRRKYNLILIDKDNKPISMAVIYHSIPTSLLQYTPILVTKHTPVSFTLSSLDHGHLYIPHLTRYSTLTIRLDQITYILSLNTKQHIYTIALD